LVPEHLDAALFLEYAHERHLEHARGDADLDAGERGEGEDVGAQAFLLGGAALGDDYLRAK
jgi:hypothetical protein